MFFQSVIVCCKGIEFFIFQYFIQYLEDRNAGISDYKNWMISFHSIDLGLYIVQIIFCFLLFGVSLILYSLNIQVRNSKKKEKM
jgi:hypothetical protein